MSSSEYSQEWSPGVEFKVQIDFLVPTLKNNELTGWRYYEPVKGIIPIKGDHIGVPPHKFCYFPPNIPPASPIQEPIYAGWALRTVAQTLNQAGFTTNWHREGHADSYLGPKDRSSPNSFNADAAWNVTLVSENLRETQEQNYVWIPVRLQTPVYGGETDCKHFGPDLSRALSAITDSHITLTPALSRMKVLVRPQGESFELSKLKRTASLLYKADPLINEIHPPHCGPGSLAAVGLQFTHLAIPMDHIDLRVEHASADVAEDPWNNRISMDRVHLLLLKHPGDLRQPRYGSGMLAIQNTESVEQLVELLDTSVSVTQEINSTKPFITPYGVRAAYGFHQIKEGDKSGWLQFNQHCSTLNFEAVAFWTDLCVGLVSIGLHKTEDEFDKILLDLSLGLKEPEKTTLPDFLRSCNQEGLEAVASYYESRDPDQLVPDLEQWPVLKKSVAEDGSCPKAEEMLRNPCRTKSQFRKEDFYRRILGNIGDHMENWHDPRKTNNPDSRYTVGIEMEMLFPVIAEEQDPAWSSAGGYRNPDPRDTRGCIVENPTQSIKLLTRVLEEHIQVPARADTIGSWMTSKSGDKESLELRRRGLASQPGTNSYQRWAVVLDSSLSTDRGWRGYYSLDGMEIVSPILRDRPEDWEAILNVVVGLRRYMKVVTDRSCGMHINVGMGTTPMPLDVLKKLACACFLADRLMFSFCHPTRELECSYCRPLSQESVIIHELPDCGRRWRRLPTPPDFAWYIPTRDLSRDEVAVLKKLWMVPNAGCLHQLLKTNNHRGSVSFRRLGILGSDTRYCTGAIEFRYSENEMDPEQILRFGQVAVALLKFADTAGPDLWKAFARNLTKCRNTWDYDLAILEKFLDYLDLSEDFEYWERKVTARREEKKVFEEWRAKEQKEFRTNYFPNPDYHESEEREEYRKSTKNQISSLKILPQVPAETVERLRHTVCRREKYIAAAEEKPLDVVPKIITPEALADFRRRATTLLQATGLTDNAVKRALNILVKTASRTGELTNKAIEDRLAKLDLELAKAGKQRTPDPEFTIEGIRKDFYETALELENDDSDYNEAFQILIHHSLPTGSPEALNVSREEIRSFLGKDGDADVDTSRPFILDDITQLKGPAVALSATSDEIRQFLWDKRIATSIVRRLTK